MFQALFCTYTGLLITPLGCAAGELFVSVPFGMHIKSINQSAIKIYLFPLLPIVVTELIPREAKIPLQHDS